MEETTQQAHDDTLYSISDEYLAKKKRNRKIIFSVISFVALVLAVAIIVMSSVKVSFKPKFIEGAVRYEITLKENSTAIVYESTDKGFKEFDQLFEETFSANYLTALFDGKLKGYEINSKDETTDDFYSDNDNRIGMGPKLKTALGDNYVRVKFDKERKLTYSNGKTYKSSYDLGASLVFDELYFNINNKNEDSTLTFYLGTRGVYKTKITKISVEANTYSLYKYALEN